MFKPSIYNIIHMSTSGKKYLYNSRTKASMNINNELNLSFLENMNDFDKLNLENKKMLIDNGFFIPESTDELAEVSYLFNDIYFEDDQSTIVLVPTLRCNFKCPYCFEKGHSTAEENPHYFEILKQHCDKYFKHKKFVKLSLFGGEPLILADKMFDYLEYVLQDSKKNDYKLLTNITTNGSLLTEEIIEKLKRYNLTSLQITLDGNRESHNKTRIYHDGRPSFDILINNIKMLLDKTKDYDFEFILRINLINREPDSLVDVLNCFEQQYRDRINVMIRPVYNTKDYHEKNSNDKSELEQFYNVAEQMHYKISKNKYYYQPCEACADSRFFYLMPDMSMWKCINDLSYEPACIGHMENDGSLFTNSKNIVDWYKAANCFNDPKCIGCKHLPDCFGGCVLYKRKNGKRSCKTFDMTCLPFCIKDEK
ncbi:MAG: radical SAM protein [Clostridia bacterium]